MHKTNRIILLTNTNKNRADELIKFLWFTKLFFLYLKNPARFIYTIKEDFCKPKDQGKLNNTSNICFRYIYTFLSNIDLLKWSFKYSYYVCLVCDLYTNNEKNAL